MRRLPVVSAVSALAAILLAVPAGARAAGQAPAGPVQEPLAIGSGGAVASMDVGASQAGIDVLKHGGNALDAAVATASALGVTIPFVAGPGGGGFVVIYLAKTHQVVTIDGRENCPAACTTTMFLDPKTGQPLDYDYASDQPLATGVPSMVAAWAKAVGLYGRKSLAADLAPAIGVAERGFRVNQDFVQLTQSDLPELQAYPASRSLLLTPSGQPLPVGTLLRNPDLAKTYRLLARYGPSYLYDGPLGQAIVQAADHPVLTPGQTVVQLPGIMTTSDLRAYQAQVRAPTRVRYRGLDIYSMAPPSSSGSTVGEALNILSGYNLAAEPRVTALFHYLEASRLAYADRNAYVGDPRYVSVPLSGLLDPVFSAGAAGGSTIPTTILQIILNHVDFGMSLPAALAAPRVSQRNAPTSLAEPDFYNSALAAQLTSQYGEKFTLATGPILPLDNYPGDATALQVLGNNRYEAIAEPVRLYGGSALVVNPAP